jgi:adenylate kinase family enzyme
MDGNYPDTLPQRLKYADTVFFLDFWRVQCLWRCVNRFWKHRGENRPELAPGCYEKIDLDFLKWIWHYPRDVRPRVLAMLAAQPDVELIVLRGRAVVDAFLKGLPAGT